ncbi:4'-phosphopantetheinyl transferase superfamily protein [Spongiivirga sp. MCCC 1A20706]|uniref:4'-phosphopantetheinyl transferase family protein n=1 Tax=Spongiivirga sp. MCCC 1A20706 TaxID=3160963 RepID=UPI003977790F
MQTFRNNLVCKNIVPDFRIDTVSHQLIDSRIKLLKICFSDYQHLVPKLKLVLDDIEINKANSYYHVKDSEHYVICRGLLKIYLARFLNTPSSRIRISYLENGKPYLKNHNKINFNVSHSKEVAILAFSDVKIGVDVEFIDNEFTFEEILNTVFSAEETNVILKSKNSTKTFYNLWTRKEAIIKATGNGIDDRLPAIPVTDGTHRLDLSVSFLKSDLEVISFQDNHYMYSIAYEADKQKLSINDKIVYLPKPDIYF